MGLSLCGIQVENIPKGTAICIQMECYGNLSEISLIKAGALELSSESVHQGVVSVLAK